MTTEVGSSKMASAPMLLEFMDNDDDVAASLITAYCCIESNTIMSTAAVAAAAMLCVVCRTTQCLCLLCEFSS